MSGYHDILRMQRLMRECDELGLIMAPTKHSYSQAFGDMVALKPKDKDSVPVYSRDAEVFVGTLEQLEVWLRGVEWARGYDMMLKLSDEKKRERKEQNVRNKQLVQILKEEELVLKK